MRASRGKDLAQGSACVRRVDLRDFLRSADGHHMPAAIAPLGTEVDDMVRRLDHVEVVLDHKQRVARLDQLAERGQELRNVIEVQPCRRLVEDIEQPLAAEGDEMRRNLDPLRLAARERGGRLAEP